MKKVEETRVRAVKINSIKAANEQSYIERIQRKNEQEANIREIQMRNA